MSSSHDRSAEPRLGELLELLRESDRRTRRTERQLRFTLATLLLLVAGIGLSWFSGPPQAMAQAAPAPAQAPTTADRNTLLAQLSPQQRQQFEEFEAQVHWLSLYMRSSQDFDAGAAVALFLSRMAADMNAVPRMHEEMRSMNAQIASLPAILHELRVMNASVGVMAGNMDSTMGRAGRMLPFMP